MKASLPALFVLALCCSCGTNTWPTESLVSAGVQQPAAPGVSLRTEYYVSPDFTPGEQAAIDRAVQDWARATEGDAAPVAMTRSEDPSVPLRFEQVDLQPEYPADLGKTLGLPGPTVTIALDRDYNQVVATWPSTPAYFSVLEFTARHELGHAMGLPHLASGLMAAKPAPVDAPIDPVAVDALETLRAGG